eukprot:15221698-Heterocapsa_arctica.AAC.1
MVVVVVVVVVIVVVVVVVVAGHECGHARFTRRPVGRELWTAVVGQVVDVAPHLEVHLRVMVVTVAGVVGVE